MRRGAIVATVLAGMLCCAGPSRAQEIPVVEQQRVYSLEELCYHALEENPRISAKASSVDAAQARVTLRHMDLLPNLNVNTNYTKSSETDLIRSGARIVWGSDTDRLRRRDIEMAELGVLSAQENLARERVWVLNDVADRYRAIAVNVEREHIYDQIIALVRGLEVDDAQFMAEKKLELLSYEAERTRIRNSITDLSSELSALAFGNPYGNGLAIDPGFIRYRPLSLDRRAVLRRAVAERMRPDVHALKSSELAVKMSTRGFKPSFSAGIEQWQTNGIAGQGYDGSNTVYYIAANWRFNPISTRALRAEANSQLAVARANVNNALNNLINSTQRALDRFELARENIESYDMEPVDFFAVMSSVPVDRQYFSTLDLYIEKDLTRTEYLSEYAASLLNLNRHVLVTPLDQHAYAGMGIDASMPEIFSLLGLGENELALHRRALMGAE